MEEAATQMCGVVRIVDPESQSRLCGSTRGWTSSVWKEYDPSFTFKNAVCTESRTEVLLRSGPVEAVQTPKSVAVGGGEKSIAFPDHGFRVDGTRHNHGLHHRTSRDQPAKTSKYLS